MNEALKHGMKYHNPESEDYQKCHENCMWSRWEARIVVAWLERQIQLASIGLIDFKQLEKVCAMFPASTQFPKSNEHS